MCTRKTATIIIAAVFLVTTAWLWFGVPEIFNSPDESANYWFTQFFSTQSIPDAPQDIAHQNRVHPRSAISIAGKVVPGSFLGLPMFYAFPTKILTALNVGHLVRVITPIVALAGAYMWRRIIKDTFTSDTLADLAAIALLFHPAYWFYSARSMMHNVPFTVLLIVGVYVLTSRPFELRHRSKGEDWSTLDMILAGVAFGSAIAFRTSEVLWIMAVLAGYIAIRYAQKTIQKKQIIILILSLVITYLPVLQLNSGLYGSWHATGYTAEQEIEQEIVVNIESAQESSVALDILFPFGIHERAIIKNVWNYGFWIYPFTSGLALIGVMIAIKTRWNQRPWKDVIIMTLALAAWLAIVYGSWVFNDNPDPSSITIANSYARYWLPLFALASVFTALAIKQMSEAIASAISGKRGAAITYIMAGCLMGTSALTVFAGEDGLISTRNNLFTFHEKQEQVLKEVPVDAIIITDTADKYLWPHRNVVVPLRDESTYMLIADLAESQTLFYFGITFPEKDLDHLKKKRGIIMNPILVMQEETLYHIEVVVANDK